MIEVFKKSNLQILIHCFLDGRDSTPISGLNNMKRLYEIIKDYKNIRVCKLMRKGFFLWIEIIDGRGLKKLIKQ